MKKFKEIKPEEMGKTPFEAIGKDWMLITAKKGDKINTMTASWGGLGYIWEKNAAFVFIRPQRYTKEFVDSADTFSLCFFDSSFKKTLGYLGSVSGRDEDKIEKSKLSVKDYEGTPYFEEANMIMLCKKLFAQEFTPGSFIDTEIIKAMYPNSDYHTLYIAEITGILKPAEE